MTKLGVMIEGQEGVTWERWNRLTDATERLGFDSLWRSDHLSSVMGVPERETLAVFPSLTAVALRTSRIEFGPLVPPTTYRHPVHLAMVAVALDHLSAGRAWIGVGAGWNVHEHEAFGFDLLPLKQRMDRMEEALKVMKLLWSGETVSFEGEHFQLQDAQSRPTPLRPEGVKLVIGGTGERRTLRMVAEYADDWNATTSSPDVYAAKAEVLERHCEAVGRDPATIRRSIMTSYIIGRDRGELLRRAARLHEIVPSTADTEPDALAARMKERGVLVGTPNEIVEQIRVRSALGVELIMLQTLDLDDIEALELIAAEVAPHIA
jgi:F420-dependent oxidoreductase-like protein